MLLEFGVKNFFCFEEAAVISLRLDKNCPTSISKGKSFVNVLGIKGANASGKTQILKGLSFLSFICAHSFSTKPDEPIHIFTYFNNTEPCELYAEFISNDITYRYELVVTRAKIESETIYKILDTGKQEKILERSNNQLVYKHDSFDDLDKINIRDNSSIVATAKQYQINALEDIYNFFVNIQSNVAHIGFIDNIVDNSALSKALVEDSDTARDYLAFIKKFIGDCDTGVSNIEIKISKNSEGEDVYYPVFIHSNSTGKHEISLANESSGTIRLYTRLLLYKMMLDTGGILIMDEFDIHLHEHILPKLIELFENEDTNKKNAQFLFTAHSTDVMDILGRYKTCLINKEDNASYIYRLDEIPGDILRNDRPVSPAYKAKKIGGVPKIGI
jgi:hypothetical protein